jgi:cysteinyl-tRNA synthetase
MSPSRNGLRGVIAVAFGLLLLVVVMATSPSSAEPPPSVAERGEPLRVIPAPDPDDFHSLVYQLQSYPHGKLSQLRAADAQIAVIDLARDAYTDWFTADEVAALRASGKVSLAYFEIGSIEDFRPEYQRLREAAPGLILNRWDEWPEEYFVKYWTKRWWRMVVRPRLNLALATGYDGVYLDTPLAYEEIPLSLADGRTRRQLGRAMVDLVAHIHRYVEARRPGLWVVPQNSPELRRYGGYLDAITGIGMEELFFRATDKRCARSWCEQNLDETRAIRDAGKLVLAIDYANDPAHREAACAAYAREGFAGYVTDVALDRVTPACP